MKKAFLLLCLASFSVTSLGAQEAGFKASLRGGVAFGSPLKESYYNLDIVLGYQFENFIYIGVGTGLNNSYAELLWMADGIFGSDRGRETDRLIPLFARVKYNLTGAQISPFVAADAGYLVAVTGKVLKEDQGFFGIPAVGVDFFVDKRRRHCFSVQIGVLIQERDWYKREPEAPLVMNSSGSEDYGRMAVRPDLKLSFTF